MDGGGMWAWSVLSARRLVLALFILVTADPRLVAEGPTLGLFKGPPAAAADDDDDDDSDDDDDDDDSDDDDSDDGDDDDGDDDDDSDDDDEDDEDDEDEDEEDDELDEEDEGEVDETAGVADRVRSLLGLPQPFTRVDDDGESREEEIVAADVDAAALSELTRRGYVPREVAFNPSLDLRAVRLIAPRGRSLSAARAEVAEVTGNEVVDRNHVYRPQATRCDGEACAPWQLVGWAEPASAGRSCGAGVAVGLVDTRINAGHEVFRGRDLEVVSTGTRGRASSAGHGTAVAALLVGAPDSRVPGLVPAARLVTTDPFTSGVGGDATDAFEIAVAIDRLVARGVRVVNLSLAGPPNRLVEQAVRRASRAGVVLVAAAGNGGPGAPPAYPAAYEQVLAVTAVDATLQPYRRAQRGNYVDLAAPGVEVPSAASVRGVRPQTGTSFAAPFVTAASAQLIASGRAEARSVHERLRASARDLGEPGFDPLFGHGLLQATDDCAPRIARHAP